MTNDKTNGATGADARAALQTIALGRQQVIDEIDMPQWYWWGLALGWIGLGVITDLRNPWLTGTATLAFGAIHSSVSQLVVSGRHRTNQLSVRAEVTGRRVALFVFAGLIALAAITIGGAIAASADGAGHPVTIASIFVAALIVLGGPRLMATVRRRIGHESTRS